MFATATALEIVKFKNEIKFILLGLFCVTFALLLSNAGDVLALQYTNYTSDKYQIQFQYPTDWILKERMNRFEEGTDITVTKPSYDGLITIGAPDDLRAGFGSTDFITAFYKAFKDVIGGDYSRERRVIEQPSFTQIDGQKAGTFVVTDKDKYDESAFEWGLQNWMAFVNGRGYLISFGTSSNQFDTPENMEIRDHLLKSIKFLGANNQTSTNTSNRFDTSNNLAFEGTSKNSTFEVNQNKNCPPMSLVLCAPPDGGPRCPNGYHRSPDGDCEPA
jgi:hypothetical protein